MKAVIVLLALVVVALSFKVIKNILIDTFYLRQTSLNKKLTYLK